MSLIKFHTSTWIKTDVYFELYLRCWEVTDKTAHSETNTDYVSKFKNVLKMKSLVRKKRIQTLHKTSQKYKCICVFWFHSKICLFPKTFSHQFLSAVSLWITRQHFVSVNMQHLNVLYISLWVSSVTDCSEDAEKKDLYVETRIKDNNWM